VNVSKGPQTGLRFPRTAKLLKHSDFQRVYKSGKRHFSGLMTVFFLPRSDGESEPRVGFTVSRALGGAVKRNRIKRRMREAVRLHRRELTSRVDVVFNPKKLAADAEFSQIESEVKKAFEVIQKATARTAKEESKPVQKIERSTAQ
jgi:ribonuclease P protein component